MASAGLSFLILFSCLRPNGLGWLNFLGSSDADLSLIGDFVAAFFYSSMLSFLNYIR